MHLLQTQVFPSGHVCTHKDAEAVIATLGAHKAPQRTPSVHVMPAAKCATAAASKSMWDIQQHALKHNMQDNNPGRYHFKTCAESNG